VNASAARVSDSVARHDVHGAIDGPNVKPAEREPHDGDLGSAGFAIGSAQRIGDPNNSR
jgi:hypothetical protein